MNKLQELKNAIDSDKKDQIIKALKLHDNPQTMVSYFYKHKSIIKNETIRNDVFNELIKPLLPERKQQSAERETKNINLKFDNVKEIIDNRYKSDIDLLIYTLLNTGRRLQEIVNPTIEVKEDDLYIKLSKGGGFRKTHLLDGDSKGTFNIINDLTGKFINNSISTQVARKLQNIDLTAHKLRDVYIMLIHKFNNPKGLIMDNIANQYLGHNSTSSDRFYTRIIYHDGDPFNNKYDKMILKELKKLAKERELKGYSRLKKKELIKLLS